MDAYFARLHERLDKIDNRLEQGFDKINRRLDSIEERLRRIHNHIGSL